MTGNEKMYMLKGVLLNFTYVVFIAGCVMAPQRMDKWIGHASEIKLPISDGRQVSALEFEIVGDSISTTNREDLFELINSGMGYRKPILVSRHGTILPVNVVPTNKLVWIKGELGSRRRVKLPDRSEAAFDGHSEFVVVSLYVMKWGHLDSNSSPQNRRGNDLCHWRRWPTTNTLHQIESKPIDPLQLHNVLDAE